MNIDEKLTLLRAVDQSGFPIQEAFQRLDIPRATYYRWRGKFRSFKPGYVMRISKQKVKVANALNQIGERAVSSL